MSISLRINSFRDRWVPDLGSDRHSRVIFWLQYGLWIFGLLSILSIFIFSGSSKSAFDAIGGSALPASFMQRESITDPHFSGVTKNGDAFSIGAEMAIVNKERPNQVDFAKPSTVLDLENGAMAFAHAGMGQFLIEEKTILLQDNVLLTLSSGASLASGGLRIDFSKGLLRSDQRTTIQNENLMIEADRIEFVARRSMEPGMRLLNKMRFTGEVVATFEPRKANE